MFFRRPHPRASVRLRSMQSRWEFPVAIDSIFASLAVWCLCFLLAAAVVSDLNARRVSNQLVVIGFALAILVQFLADREQVPGLAGASLVAPLVGAVLGGIALLPLYVLRACGAGDVKLLAMVGAFVGPTHVPLAALYTMLAGGLLAVLWMLGRGIAIATFGNLYALAADFLAWVVRAPRKPTVAPLQRTAARMPYAVAIATGTMASLVPALQVLR